MQMRTIWRKKEEEQTLLLLSHIGRSPFMRLHLCTLALSSTMNVFLRIRIDSLSRKSAILSAVIFFMQKG